ncbi:hypothetical protein Tco_0541913, partial [Tanacetum coccineum]
WIRRINQLRRIRCIGQKTGYAIFSGVGCAVFNGRPE